MANAGANLDGREATMTEMRASASSGSLPGDAYDFAGGPRNDLRSRPVQRLVVMGDSIAYGMAAGDAGNEWVQILAGLIRGFQDAPLRIFNNSIPANVISPAAPGYDAKDVWATAPSAIEHYEQDMIAYAPDLAVYAYGLNDARCGHALPSFMQAYREMVVSTVKRLPDALPVLVGPYWGLQFDAQAWANTKYEGLRVEFGKFALAGDRLVLAYNAAIADLAAETGALFVNLYSLLEGAPWLLNADMCHFNDIGQALIGMKVFLDIAAHCSFLSLRSRHMEEQLRLGIWDTGGTDALPQAIDSWRKIDTWKR